MALLAYDLGVAASPQSNTLLLNSLLRGLHGDHGARRAHLSAALAAEPTSCHLTTRMGDLHAEKSEHEDAWEVCC